MIFDKNGKRNVNAESSLLNGILGMIPGALVGGPLGALASFGLGLYAAQKNIKEGEENAILQRGFERVCYDEKIGYIISNTILNSAQTVYCEKIDLKCGDIFGIKNYKNTNGEPIDFLHFNKYNWYKMDCNTIINDFRRAQYDGRADKYELYRFVAKEYEYSSLKEKTDEVFVRRFSGVNDNGVGYLMDSKFANDINSICGTTYNVYDILTRKMTYKEEAL